ncbi:hypothetical protein ACFL7E_05685 [Thermodesulfobacteriota bacterium]
MKIIGLKSYGNGYTGFLEEEDAYEHFVDIMTANSALFPFSLKNRFI